MSTAATMATLVVAGKPFMRWLVKTNYVGSDFARDRSELGLDKGSSFAAPQFVAPAARDYRLMPGTPCTALATGGGPVGAHW